MSEKVTAMIEEIKGLTVLELSELVHALEEEFGVSAAAMAAPAAGGAAPAAEEKTEFDVVLAGFDAAQQDQGHQGPSARSPAWAWLRPRRLSRATPTTLKEALSKDDAETMKKDLKRPLAPRSS